MNRPINQIMDFFWNLDKKQFKNLYIILLTSTLTIFGLTIYLQFNRIKTSQKKMVEINNNRQLINKILEENEILKMRKKRGEEIIAKDKDFFLKKYFEDLVDSHQLRSNLKSVQLITNDPENLRAQGYQEVVIDAILENIDMKQFVELLNDLENKDRIVIKKIELDKSKQQPTINVSLTISTLELKTGTVEAFETE